VQYLADGEYFGCEIPARSHLPWFYAGLPGEPYTGTGPSSGTLEVVLGTYLKMPRAKFRHTLINCSKKAGLCSSLKPLRHPEDIEGEGATTIGEGCSLKLAPTWPKIAGVRKQQPARSLIGGLFPPDSAFSGYASHAAKRHSVLEVTRPGQAAPSTRQIEPTPHFQDQRGQQHLYRPLQAPPVTTLLATAPAKSNAMNAASGNWLLGGPARSRGQEANAHCPPTAQTYCTSQPNGGPRKLHT
jgi:hypothetical protein